MSGEGEKFHRNQDVVSIDPRANEWVPLWTGTASKSFLVLCRLWFLFRGRNP